MAYNCPDGKDLIKAIVNFVKEIPIEGVQNEYGKRYPYGDLVERTYSAIMETLKE